MLLKSRGRGGCERWVSEATTSMARPPKARLVIPTRLEFSTNGSINSGTKCWFSVIIRKLSGTSAPKIRAQYAPGVLAFFQYSPKATVPTQPAK